MALIELDDIWKVYDLGEVKVEALRGVSLSIEEGEFVALMGPSGSGKSTLMNVVGCLDRPTKGSYLLDGEEISSMSRDARARIRNRQLGFVFQNFNLLSRTSARENVELPLLYGENTSARARHHRATELLDTVGLSDRAHHHPGQLSGGQQQRVAIARALANEPSLLMADEPTGNLDTRTSIDVMKLFQGLNREKQLTIVLVTHEWEIAQYAGRVIVLRDGLIIADTPDITQAQQSLQTFNMNEQISP